MRRSIRLIALFVLFISVSVINAAGEDQVQNAGIWPGFDNPDAVAVDNQRNLVFYGSGDLVGIYASDMKYLSHLRLPTKSGIRGIDYDPDTRTLYIAAGTGGFILADVSDSLNPSVITSVRENPNNPGLVMGAEVKNINAYALKYTSLTIGESVKRFVFLADRNFGMRVYDVTVPALASEYGRYRQDSPYETGTTGGYVNIDTFIYGGRLYAFVLDSYYGLRIFDVTSPASILKPVSKDLRDFYYNSTSLVKDLAVGVYSGALYCFVSGPNTMSSKAAVVKYRIDTDSSPVDPETTNVKEIRNIGRCDTLATARGISLKGNYVFVADNDKGIRVVDVMNPVGHTDSNLESYGIKAEFSSGMSGVYSVFVNGNSLYVSDFRNGLRVFDISSPEFLLDSGYQARSLINTKAVAMESFQVVNTSTNRFQNRTFSFMLSDGDAPALYIFDVTEKDAITLESVKPLDTELSNIKILNDFAFIASGSYGLCMLNISDPRMPGEIVRIDTPGFANDVAVSNGYVFIADGSSGLAVSDIRNPDMPSQVSSYPVMPGSEVKGIDINGKYAFMAAGEKGLAVADISVPDTPVVPVSSVDTPGDASDIHLAYNSSDKTFRAYIADGGYGLQVVDVTDPLHPKQPLQTYVAGVATDVFVSGDYAYVSKGDNGYAVIDIVTPQTSTVSVNYSTYGTASGITVYKDYVYVADGSGVLNISRFSRKDENPPEPLETSDPESACFIRSVSINHFKGFVIKINDIMKYLQELI